MYNLNNYIGETLVLNQPSLRKREYELIANDEVLATLVFPKLLSNRAIAEISDSKLEFKQPSIWKGEYGIYKAGYQMPFAKYVSNFWKTKGTIELPKGARLNCKSGKLKRPFEIYSSLGEPLVIFENKLSLRGKTVVTIQKDFELLDRYPWIIMLACYIIIIYRRARAAR